MKYLSFDIEATGLDEHDLIIEFSMIPFCTTTKTLNHDLSKHYYVKCPPFKTLQPNLNEWVVENNKTLIEKANKEGIELDELKTELEQYFNSSEVKSYFENKKITLFGKSMNAIDLPFLNRDLGWEWMRNWFNHRNLDLSSVSYSLIDLGHLPEKCVSGSGLMNYCNMGDVAHTALEDAINTAKMYLFLIDKFKK